MAGIRGKDRNFKRYLEKHFGMSLPADVSIFYAKGVRIGNTAIQKSGIKGELGYAACDEGFNPTNAIAQNLGHLATKNTLTLDSAKAREFALGRGIGGMDLGQKSMFVILKYGGFPIGLGYYDAEQRKIRNRIPEKRRRKMINEL